MTNKSSLNKKKWQTSYAKKLKKALYRHVYPQTEFVTTEFELSISTTSKSIKKMLTSISIKKNNFLGFENVYLCLLYLTTQSIFGKETF